MCFSDFVKKSFPDIFRIGLDERALVELAIPNIEKQWWFFYAEFFFFDFFKRKFFFMSFFFRFLTFLLIFFIGFSLYFFLIIFLLIFIFLIFFYLILIFLFKVTKITNKKYERDYCTPKPLGSSYTKMVCTSSSGWNTCLCST